MQDKTGTKESLLLILIVCILLTMAILAMYWQVTGFDFVNFDDNVYISDNIHVQKGLSLESVKWAFHLIKPGDRYYWHPLTWISHMVDCQIFGLNAGMHHLSNVIYHIMNTLLLFLTLRWVTGSTWKSSFVALIFAIHPVNVDSVAWLAERKNLLSTFFWILTILFYNYYAKRPTISRYLIVVTIFMLGILSKPMLVSLPFILFLLDFWPLNRIHLNGDNGYDTLRSLFKRNNAILVLEKLPLLIISILLIIYNSYALSHTGAYISNQLIPLDLRIENAIVSYVLYIQKMVWPAILTFYYPYPTEVSMLKVVGSTILLLMITFSALNYSKKYPYILFGWFWFLGALVPVSGIIQGGLWPEIAERWAYVPFIGLFIIIAWGAPDILKKLEKREIVLYLAAFLVILPLSVRTWIQIGSWKNELTLYQHALEVNSNNELAHANLGAALVKKGYVDEGISHLKVALSISPGFPNIYFMLGTALGIHGELNHAEKYFLKGFETDPYNATAHYIFGLLLERMGKNNEAINHFNESLKIEPYNAQAHYALGNYLEGQGQMNEAILHYNETLKIDPKNANAHYRLGEILSGKGKDNEAFIHYNEALNIDPNNLNIHSKLGAILSGRGKNDEAAIHFNYALKVDPKNSNAHIGLGIILIRKGKLDEAASHFNEALKIDPKNANAHVALGILLKGLGRNDEAVKHYNEALRIDPNNVNAHIGLGTFYEGIGKNNDAIKHFYEVIRINPSSIEAHKNMGNLLLRKGNYDEAIMHYTEALRMNQHQADVLNNLGTAFLYKKDIKKAIENFQASLREMPDYAEAMKNIKNARINQKILECLATKTQALVKSDPLNPALHTKLGDIYRQLGEYNKAASHYQKVISIQTGSTRAMYGLVLVYSDCQEYANALDVLKKMLQSQPGKPEIYYNIACIYAKQNRIDESIVWLKQAIDKGFNNWGLIRKDPDLGNIRKTSYGKKLLYKEG